MITSPPPAITIGSRSSALAMWQTNHIKERLQATWPGLSVHIEPFVTKGDKVLDKPLPQIGGKGLFTSELEAALHDGRIQLAVHSLKDLPVEDADGLTLGAIMGRADVRDVLIAKNGWTLGSLPPCAIVGTSSLRRQAQLLAVRSDLQVKSIRGNVGTRVNKVINGEYDAAVLAAAGVTRLGLEAHISQWLPLGIMLSAPGQGALAIQCRADDAMTLRLLEPIDQPQLRACVTAERSFLNALDSGCSTPVAAYATYPDDSLHNGRLHMTGLVGAPDGSVLIRVEGHGANSHELGVRLANEALAQGAGEILMSND